MSLIEKFKTKEGNFKAEKGDLVRFTSSKYPAVSGHVVKYDAKFGQVVLSTRGIDIDDKTKNRWTANPNWFLPLESIYSVSLKEWDEYEVIKGDKNE